MMNRQDKIEYLRNYMPSMNLYELPHDFVDVLFDMANAIQDSSMPTWFRVTTELWFDKLEQGVIDVMDEKEGVKAMQNRNSQYDGDYMGSMGDD